MNQPPLPARIPETMGPDEIGPYLRQLREQFNLTQQDVSERLHIRVRYVSAIEEAKYENMPGKVYARGYVHTYAEFLGLDPEQVVAQCFSAGAPVAATPVLAVEAAPLKPVVAAPFVAKTFASPTLKKKSSNGMLVLAALGVGAIALGFMLLSGGSSPSVPDEANSVAPVPEALLASVRSDVMPVMNNYDCLTYGGVLPCFFAQHDVQQLQLMQAEMLQSFEAEIADALAHPPVAEPTEPAPAAAETESHEPE